jgi:hypothetical protein
MMTYKEMGLDFEFITMGQKKSVPSMNYNSDLVELCWKYRLGYLL